MPPLDAQRNYGYQNSYRQKGFEMSAYSVADAKNSLPKLIDKALAGEEVIITRRGKPVVELKCVERPQVPRPRGMLEWLRSRRDARPGVGLTSVEILDLLYETDP